MVASINCCGSLAKRPKGDLVYCSYRCIGAAGLGTDYCELIADQDSIPKVVVVLNNDNRFGEPVIRQSFPVEKSTVDSLSRILAEKKVYKLNGYYVNEAICGGHAYSFHLEYSSGDKVSASWYGHHIKDEAYAAYYLIEHFFRPWCVEARKKTAEIVAE